MRVVFMGTPEFAVPSLKILVENAVDVVGVVTAPDKPQGRGRKWKGTALKQYAEEAGLNILQPANLKSLAFLQQLRTLNADLQIVVAFRMLPEAVWSMPPLGTFNLHASLLPQYRGAAPVNWAIINGEIQTGVTTFFLKHEIDTGSIIYQDTEDISAEDTAGAVYKRLMHKGAQLVLKTVRAIESNDYELKEQLDDGSLKPAPKIHKHACEIDWTAPAADIVNFVRGLSPYPAAWTELNGRKYKVYRATLSDIDHLTEAEPGQHDTREAKTILVQTGKGVLSLDILQPEGKKRMKAEDFLRGNKL